jgi:hypothetical protein
LEEQDDVEEHNEDISMSEHGASDASDAEDGEQEEAEWSGAGEDNGAETDPHGSAGKSKRKKGIPTGEELRAIKEGVELFKSNTFKLQVSSSDNYFKFSLNDLPCLRSSLFSQAFE